MRGDMSKLFPRDWRGRVALAISSLFFLPVSVMGAYMFFVHARPKRLLDQFIVVVTADLFFAMALFFATALIWAAATPRWLERLQAGVSKRLVIALFSLVLTASAIAAWTLIFS